MLRKKKLTQEHPLDKQSNELFHVANNGNVI